MGTLRQALFVRECGGLGDGELLGRFLAEQDEAAFTALVRRHGPMVLGVCRRVLGHVQDAEDAFQATFLVLLRGAASIRKQESVGNWLYGVAYRTALEARAAAARRHATERQVETMPEPTVGPAEVADDLRPVLDAELSRLPARYREAVVLCDLEGRPRREAARQLGIPEGTLSSRLAAGRRRLAGRLARRGITLSAGALAAGLGARTATAAVPAQLVQTTVGSALALAAGPGAAGAVSAHVAVLTERVVRAMLLTRVKSATVVLLLLAFLGAGAGVLRNGATSWAPVAAAQEDGPAGGEPGRPEKDAGRQAQPPEERQDVWTLDFHFKDLRSLTVNVPGEGKKVVWYLLYEVANPTAEPHTFVPDLELVTLDKQNTHPDKVLPKVEEAIRQVEDPTAALRIKDSVTIAAQPIPPAGPGETPPRVNGLAIWDAVEPDTTRASLFVGGLSNAWSVTEPVPPDTKPQVRRKALQLNFKRAGDRIEFVPPARWVYRMALLQPALDVTARQLDATERQRAALEKMVDIVARERDDLRKQLAALREEVQQEREKTAQGAASQNTEEAKDRFEALQGLQRELAGLKAKERDRRIYLEFLMKRVRSLRPPAGKEESSGSEAERRRERFRMMKNELDQQLQAGDEEEATRDLHLAELTSRLLTLRDLPAAKGEGREVPEQIEAVLAAADAAHKDWAKEREQLRKEVEGLRKELGKP